MANLQHRLYLSIASDTTIGGSNLSCHVQWTTWHVQWTTAALTEVNVQDNNAALDEDVNQNGDYKYDEEDNAKMLIKTSNKTDVSVPSHPRTTAIFKIFRS